MEALKRKFSGRPASAGGFDTAFDGWVGWLAGPRLAISRAFYRCCYLFQQKDAAQGRKELCLGVLEFEKAPSPGIDPLKGLFRSHAAIISAHHGPCTTPLTEAFSSFSCWWYHMQR